MTTKATWREWVGLAVLCLPTMLAAVDINVMFLALPHVSEDLGAGSTQQLWITDIYGFMITGFLVTMGTLGDRIGRRKILLLGAAGFIAASLFAAYSTSPGSLIVARALMGVFGAAVTPSVLAIIRTMFKDPKQMGAAMGVWGTSIMGGIVFGPIVGGLLLGSFWWGSIFIMSVPVMGLLLLAGPFLIPDSRNPKAGSIDVLSVVLSLGAILPLVYGLKETARTGWNALPIIAIVAGAVFLFLFVQRQRAISSPLLDLALFRSKVLGAAALLALFVAFVAGGVGLNATLWMQLVKGLSPVQVALWLLAPSIAMIFAANLSPAISRKVKPGIVLAIGAIIGAIGLVVITQVGTASGMGLLLTGLIITYVGGGMIGIPSATLIMVSAPPEKAGSAGSLSATLGEFGTALGVAVLGLIGTVAYRANMPGTGPAHESIAGAVTTANGDAALLNQAREAFTSGLHVVAICAAVLYVGLAVLSLVGLREVPATGDAPAAPPWATPAQDSEEPVPAAS